MGAVEDTRKVIQNSSTPELRLIQARVDCFAIATRTRLDVLDVHLKAMEQVSAARHEAVMGAITHLSLSFGIAERLARLEAQNENRASH